MNAPRGSARNTVSTRLPDDLYNFLTEESNRVKLTKSHLLQLAVKALRDFKND
jgi:hypothetical protein